MTPLKIVNLSLFSNLSLLMGSLSFLAGQEEAMTVFFLSSLVCTYFIAKELILILRRLNENYNDINLLRKGVKVYESSSNK